MELHTALSLPMQKCIESKPCVLNLTAGVLKQHTFEKSVMTATSRQKRDGAQTNRQRTQRILVRHQNKFHLRTWNFSSSVTVHSKMRNSRSGYQLALLWVDPICDGHPPRGTLLLQVCNVHRKHSILIMEIFRSQLALFIISTAAVGVL